MTRYRIGADVGGTFTDFVLADGVTGRLTVLKLPSTPDHPSAAILAGIEELSRRGALVPGEIGHFVHGTTLALNTILERKGAAVGLLVTKGFKDILQLRRLRLANPSNLDSEVPVPLVPRRRVAEVRERMRADGTIEEALDEESLGQAAEAVITQGADCLVISFLHAYRNPGHEQRAKAILQERFPDMYICTSSEIWPQQREYERTLLSVMNAYVGRRMASYFMDLTREARERGLTAPIFSTRSNGGMLTAASAARTPAVTLLSGPAAGVMGAVYLAQQAGLERVVTLDMGGTSADVAVVDGSPNYSTENQIGDFPVIMPAVDISSIGAGGGSIAWLDDLGVLKVGPQSAGAMPGPACYGRGGTEATVTDAYLTLGIIAPDSFLGGTMHLDRARAEQAIGALADRLGRPVRAAAAAIVDVATANMEAQFLPLMARHGVDATRFTLLPYGGAGATHAFLLARQVGIRQVLIPPVPGALSALGCLVADVRADFVETIYAPLAALTDEQLTAAYGELLQQARAWLAEQGARVERTEAIVSADMRYVGQSFEISTPLPVEGDHIRVDAVAEAFHRQYAAIYHASDPDAPPELVNLRVQLVGVTRKPSLAFSDVLMSPDGTPGSARRAVYLNDAAVEVPVYARGQIAEGQTMPGPCVIEQYDTTILVLPEFEITADSSGNLIGKAR